MKQVITYAKLYGRNKAARHFDLNASIVGHWVTASKGWDSELNQDSKRIGSGQKAFYPEAEEKLYTWLIEQRKQGLAVTYTILRIKMQNILKEREMITLYGGSAKEFKTSYGTKLPLICIFKGKQLSKGEKIPPGVVVWFQDKGWMDSELMNRYIDYLGDEINKRTGARAPKLMVYDSFRGYLEKSVKEKFRDYGFDLGIILGGLTSLCQPLDVAINKPFKANLRKEWHLWMAAGGAGQTNKVENFDNEIIDISDDDLEDGINDNLEHD
ncbi:pogo transposable element with KRAB domain [Rhizophagus irregularis DAOM 181602=DAOM 197198]|nr:pogo transposable element with KRAB domain [Rhizophagus irregularis DAOM 181602=DAOM 197198]